MMISRHHVNLAVRKAKKSSCHVKVSALGFNWKGDLIARVSNRPRFSRKGGGLHAEMRIMLAYPMTRFILLCRVNNKGEIRPLHPCRACKAKADELSIRFLEERKIGERNT